ncbi:MAG: S8 family serine peptidase [Acidobacteria bacterium]|nr:S8 family serine peptidase [Acidobacteriota bacterium]
MNRTAALLLLVPAAFAQPRPRTGEYALILRDASVAQAVSSREALHSSAALAQRRKVEAAQRAVLAELARRHVAVHGTFSLLANAIYVDAANADPAALAAIPGVRHVEFLPLVRPALNAAVNLVNAPAAWSAVGGASNAGAGVKIGIIDTGIDQTHPGFNDAGFTAPPGFPKGDTGYTSNKVIVARSYVTTLVGTNPASTTPDDLSPRDRMGHGTAIAMIAAGVQNTAPLGAIQGVAPKAWLGNYKIFGSPGINEFTFDSTVQAALEDAVNDGMDIVTLSINEGDPAQFGPLDTGSTCETNDPTAYCDIRAERIKEAVAKGLTVVAAAGNSGNSGANTPTRNSLHSPGTAPDAITVGATLNSHIVYQTVRYGGTNVRGLFGDGTRPQSPLSGQARDVAVTGDNGLACSPLPAGSLTGRIALIQRGTCYIYQKLNNAQAAGAIAAILYQTDGVDDLPPTLFIRPAAIPVITIGNTDGKAFKSYLASNPDAAVTLDPAFAAGDNPAVSQVAPFSSRGPSIGNFAGTRDFALKPELVAPGVGVYTATEKYDPNGDAYNSTGYTTVSGTSYAVPFVAGAAALVKQNHSGFTPAQLKSSVVNTANFGAVQGGAHLVDAGAGLLNVADAVNIAATLDPAAISFGALNPSSLPINRNLTITNVSPAQATFNFAVRSLSGESGSSVQVTPSSVSLAAGASQAVTVALTGTPPAAGSYEGFVDVTGAGPALHLPYTYFVGNGTPGNVMALIGGGFLGFPGDTGWRLAMRVTDTNGVPVPNYPTTFGMQSGGGKIEGGSQSTDAIGTAAWLVDLGPQLGDQLFVASVGGLTQTFDGYARPAPAISAGGIVNAASQKLGAGIAPGSYISIYGSYLSTAPSAVFSTPYLPLAVASVSVSFDGANGTFPGRIHFVSPGQVNVFVPWELAGQTSAQMKVIWTFDTNYWTGLVTVPVTTYSPGIFAITDANGALINSSNPAKRGAGLVIYANGLGPLDLQPATGQATPPTTPLANTTASPTVTIGAAPAQVLFSGLTPGSIGLYQVNVLVPDGAPSGSQALTLSIGGQSVTVTVPVG